MIPAEIKQAILGAQHRIARLEALVKDQADANVGYHEVCHELAESWDALDRAIDKLDEVAEGAS